MKRKLPVFYWGRNKVSLLWLVLLFWLGLQSVTAQNPLYAGYESFSSQANMTAAGWITAEVAFNSSAANARSGAYYMQKNNSATLNAVIAQTPDIERPKEVGFFIRKNSNTTMAFEFQVSADGGTTWDTVVNSTIPDVMPNGGILIEESAAQNLSVLPNGNSSFFHVYVRFSSANSFTVPYKFRIVDTRPSLTVGSLFIDDFYWISQDADLNNIVIPELGTSTRTVSVDSAETLYFYDVGGSSDRYSVGAVQNNDVTFVPLDNTAKIRATIEAFHLSTLAGAATLRVYNDATFTTLVGNYTGNTIPGLFTSTDVNGALSFRFVGGTAAALNHPDSGYRIRIEVVKCLPPLSFDGEGSSSSAHLWWGNNGGEDFDIHYSTTNIAPNSGATVHRTVTGGTTYTSASPYQLTGLTIGTTYYVWIRNNCGVSEKSNWIGPVPVTAICDPVTVPYLENFNGLPNSSLPACTSSDSSTWAVNNLDGRLFTNGAGTNFYTKGISLLQGTYRLSYDYQTFDPINNVAEATMRVYYGMTDYTPATASYSLVDNGYHDHFSTILTTNVTNFTVATAGVYYIRFEYVAGYPAGATVNIDNIRVEEEHCFPPVVNPTPSSVLQFSATVNWNAPSLGTPIGYEYFVSTSSTRPNYSDLATGSSATTSTTLSLSPDTTYYVWVRTDCGSGLNSVWSVNYITFTTDTVPVTSIKINDSGNKTVSCGSSETVLFYDSGGASGNYSNYENYTKRFVLSSADVTAGRKLKVVFTTFNTENNYDGLRIYNGQTIMDEALVSSGRAAGTNATTCPAGAFSGTALPPSIISTADDGSLTFVFTSDVSITPSGWSAIITCVTVPVITDFTDKNNNCGEDPTPTVVITGRNFLTVPLTGAVFFGSIPAVSYVINSDTQITATAPAGGSTGKIRITNGTETGYSSTNFEYQEPRPVATGVEICVGGSGVLTSPATISGYLDAHSSTVMPNFYNGTWNSSTDLIANRPATSITNAPVCNFASGVTRNYQTLNFQVSVTGTYVLRMDTPADGMAYIAVAGGSFVPGTCTNPGWVIGDDDSSSDLDPRLTVVLTAGVTYTLYSTTWGSSSGTSSSNYSWHVVSNPLGGSILLNVPTRYVNWYRSDGEYLYTGDTFNPVGFANSGLVNTNATGDHIFYAGFDSTPVNCRTETIFKINSQPTVTLPAVLASCANSIVPVTVVGTADNFEWSSSVVNTLFEDAAATIPYNPLNNLTTIYVRTLTTAIVTVTATNDPCTAIESTTIAVESTSWDGSIWSNGAPSSSKAVIFDADFTSVINVNACSVTVNSGVDVIFDSGHTLTVEGVVSVVSGGSLIFEDDASLLQHNDVSNGVGVYNGGNTGNIVSKRSTTPVFRNDYTYWSAPVYPQAILDFSPLSVLAYYYEPLLSPQWRQVTDLVYGTPTPIGTMIPAKGYIIRAPSNYPTGAPAIPSTFTGEFEGVPNNGDISIGVSGGTDVLNLIGNPYPSAIDIERFLIEPTNASLLQGTVYLWTHNTAINTANSVDNQYAASDYALFNFTGILGTGSGTPAGNFGVNNNAPTKHIASGQSFFIKGDANGTAIFKNSMRVAGNNGNFFKMQNGSTQNAVVVDLEKHRYWLDIFNSQGAFKQTLVGYVETATNGIDRLFDGDLVETENVVSLYTLVDTKRLSIQGRSLPFDVYEQLPLAYTSTIDATYTIRLSQYDGLFVSQNVYLEDKQLNLVHNLHEADYSFATVAGTFDDRFVLRYTNSLLDVKASVFDDNSVVVYKNKDGLFINSGVIPMKSVTIFDIRGRQIADKTKIHATETKFENIPDTQQVILVKVEGENGQVVTKRMVY